jgi:hypothetical protein
MESFNNNFSELSNTNIKVKIKEFGMEYEFTKQQIVKLCDKLEELEKNYKKAKEELTKRGVE